MTHSGGILIICFSKNHNSIIRICLCSGISRKVFKPNSSVFWQAKNYQHKGQKDSPELPETPEIMEMTENFTKVTKYLSKFKETLINCLGKISRQKAVRIKFSVDSAFLNLLYGKKRKSGNARNQQKAF